MQYSHRDVDSRRALGFALGMLFIAGASTAQGDPPLTSPPHASVHAGVVEGSLPEGAPGAVFKGIPFAAPPVGALRWQEPADVQPWREVKEAVSFSPPCLQEKEGTAVGSEDCLYLNVWTPEWPLRGSHPVLVWLFGGANSVGSAGDPLFDGAALARRGLVVVTANYRLGVFGFLALPELSAESPHGSSGNYALLDQIMVLRWVRENIAALGGDPQHVTLFGQSSGSYDLLLLMTSPLAKGLFANAIAQSGQLLAFGGSMAKGRAEGIGKHIASELNAPEGARKLEYLRKLSAKRLLAVGEKRLNTSLGSDMGLLTNVDGWVLPELPARVFASGREMAIPLIVGNNAREITPQASPDELRQEISRTYGDLGPKALEIYGLANGWQGVNDPLLGGAGAQWMTDTVQRCPAVMEAGWHAAAGNPTWEYQFERALPGHESEGASHGAEVGFVFGTLDFGAADRKASDSVQGYWTQFAKAGDPNDGTLPTWPQAKGGRYLALTPEGPVAKENLQARACGVFREWAWRGLER